MLKLEDSELDSRKNRLRGPEEWEKVNRGAVAAWGQVFGISQPL